MLKCKIKVQLLLLVRSRRLPVPTRFKASQGATQKLLLHRIRAAKDQKAYKGSAGLKPCSPTQQCVAGVVLVLWTVLTHQCPPLTTHQTCSTSGFASVLATRHPQNWRSRSKLCIAKRGWGAWPWHARFHLRERPLSKHLEQEKYSKQKQNRVTRDWEPLKISEAVRNQEVPSLRV